MIKHARAEELVEEVHELISIVGWKKLFSIRDQATQDFTLEVLASFDFDRSHADFSSEDMIWFSALRQFHSISLKEFSVTLGLYNRDYIHTKEYAQLPFDIPDGVTPSHVC